MLSNTQLTVDDSGEGKAGIAVVSLAFMGGSETGFAYRVRVECEQPAVEDLPAFTSGARP